MNKKKLHRGENPWSKFNRDKLASIARILEPIFKKISEDIFILENKVDSFWSNSDIGGTLIEMIKELDKYTYSGVNWYLADTDIVLNYVECGYFILYYSKKVFKKYDSFNLSTPSSITKIAKKGLIYIEKPLIDFSYGYEIEEIYRQYYCYATKFLFDSTRFNLLDNTWIICENCKHIIGNSFNEEVTVRLLNEKCPICNSFCRVFSLQDLRGLK